MLTIGDICESRTTGKRYVVVGLRFDRPEYVEVVYADRPSLRKRPLLEASLRPLVTGRLEPATVSFERLMLRCKYGNLSL